MAKILLFLGDKTKNRLLDGLLSKQYEVIPACSEVDLKTDFDLAIIDHDILRRFGERIKIRKEEESPVFLPFILVSTRKNMGRAVQHFSKTIDEIIVTPIEKNELYTRIRVLLRMRELSAEVHSRCQNIFDKVPFGLCRMSAEGYILEANLALAEMLGYPGVETLEGLRIMDMFVDSDEKKRWQELVERRESMLNFEAKLRRKNGSVIWVEKNLMPVKNSEGRVLYFAGCLHNITGRKLAELRVRDSELKYKCLFESVEDAVLLIHDGKLVDCNERASSIFGLSRDGIIGKTLCDLSPPFQPGGIPSRDLFSEKIKLALTEGPQHFECQHCRPDNNLFIAGVTMIALDIGEERLVHAIVRDITVSKQIEASSAEFQRKYFNLVENINSIILCWDRDGIIKFINKYGLQFFGYSAEELIGRNVVGTIVPPVDRNGRDMRQMIKEICDNPAAFERNINENIRRNGERVLISWNNKVEIDELGKVKEILSVGVDITERIRAEEEIRDLNEKLKSYAEELEKRVAERTSELEIAKKRAEEADRVKSAFLATMSHELRTPLNSIIGFTGILLKGLAGPLNDEQAKQLRMVQNSASHLLELINDVLDISKIEAGQLEVASEPVDMDEVVKKVIRSAAPLAEKKGLALLFEMAPEVGQIISDRRRVEQILLNLINNAIKFTNQGEVRIRCWTEEGWVMTSVSDSGIGIKPEDIEKIFKPFCQLDIGLSREYEGTGLGLSICKRLVELLGGKIWVESEGEGKGSMFKFSLPVRGPGGNRY